MIIGLTGYAQHGKDTTGEYLVQQYGFKRYAFADQLKELALYINPYVDGKYTLRLWQLVQDAGWENAKKEPEVRRFLQELGTGVREILGEDAWVDALVKKIRDDGLWDRQGPKHDAKIVITDVRFPNEARLIRDRGGFMWRVKRVTKLSDGVYVDYDNGLGTEHPSEKFISVLPTDSTMVARNVGDLYWEADGLMKSNRIRRSS